ncbi:MAG: DUF2130 domain-containing protein [Polyangiales bacterium]
MLRCPSCGHEFEVEKEIEEAKRQAVAEAKSVAEKEVAAAKKKAVDDAKAAANAELSEKVAAALSAQSLEFQRERTKQSQVAEEAAMKLKLLEEQASEHRKKELALIKEREQLLQKEAEREVETQRRISDEAKKLNDESAARAKEAFEARIAEENKKRDLERQEAKQREEQMLRKIEALQQQAQQGSMQVQGEAQEAALKEMLQNAFTFDAIDDVPTGMRGADLLQTVRDGSGLECGTIIWESKRTKHWSNDWLPKLRDDQRAAKASIAVLVSEVLPDGVDAFGLVDEVYVCSWRFAVALAAALRQGVVQIGRTQRAALGKSDKMSLLYAYLTGPEFRHQIEGAMEAFSQMQDDLNKEKRVMTNHWKKREKQLERAMMSLSGFYGDVRGIAGGVIEALPALELDDGGLDEFSDGLDDEKLLAE